MGDPQFSRRLRRPRRSCGAQIAASGDKGSRSALRLPDPSAEPQAISHPADPPLEECAEGNDADSSAIEADAAGGSRCGRSHRMTLQEGRAMPRR